MTPQADEPPREPAHDFTAEVLARLGARTSLSSRYRIEREIASGGMGAVLRVWDDDLRRVLAMKIALAQPDASSSSASRSGSRVLARFFEEAQVTGQLDHPGVVPVHELGLDEQGRAYFTMRLVAGRDLAAICKLAHEGGEGWTQTRVVGVLLKVCETMAYAHDKGVVHRDLKPANVMVGGFGEVYVMDWGLARVLGTQADTGAAADDSPARTPAVSTDRGAARASSADAALNTMDGDILGTPAFMSPEQARGAVDTIGPLSDVYSLGAILYQLLTGHAPYVLPNVRTDSIAVWSRVRAGPPEPLAEQAPQAPAELCAICERAMQRDPAQRYPSMLAFADDLRAYLEGRVVRAYQTGAYAELKKWVARNKALAATAGAAIVLLSVGSTSVALWMASKNTELKLANGTALTNEQRAQHNAEIADARAAQVLRLSDITQLRELENAANSLWPAHPRNIEAYEGWLKRAETLASRRALHQATLESLRAGASSGPTGASSAQAAWTFATPEDQWQHDTLADLVARLERFSDPERGLVHEVRKRLEFARTVTERSLESPAARELWDRARASIADRAQCPAYAGLALAPQLGLLPLGRDPSSHLWEFAQLQTGAPAVRDPDTGDYAITGDTGLVFVLLPGGKFEMGAQGTDPSGANYDRQANENEGPVTEIALAPFFMSKYEMTQGQWLHFTGENPSYYVPGMVLGDVACDLSHPVEQVSWTRCSEVLARLDLLLPTEAQWEYGARAGTHTPWSSGAEKDTLEGAANLADQAAARINAKWPSIADWPDLDDGFPVHAPVGSFHPNAFGLYDVHGNVWEWCRDALGRYDEPPREGDGERPGSSDNRMIRGGSFYHSAAHARSSHRNNSAPDLVINHLGVRPARMVEK